MSQVLQVQCHCLDIENKWHTPYSVAGMWAKMSDIGIGVAKDDDDNLVIVASMRVPNINLFNVKRH